MERQPRILILTIEAWNWNANSPTSSTLANIFKFYDSENKAAIYTREELPSDNCCSRYFRISENKVVKSVFRRNLKTGEEVFPLDDACAASNEDLIETRKRYGKYKSNAWTRLARDLVWYIGRWKTKELDDFLSDFKPDIVVFGMEGCIYFHRLCRYVLKKTGARGIGIFWDDNFTYKQTQNKKAGFLLRRFLCRISLKKLAKKTDAFFAVAEKTKREADHFFEINCEILTKAISPSSFFEERKEISFPIKMVYTGNLKIGRFDSLKLISDALYKIDNAENLFHIDIYSNTELDRRQTAALHPAIKMNGSIPMRDCTVVQENADVLLFLEDIVGENKYVARLSFSTKITDYLERGKCICAIVKSGTAPYEYFADEKCAIQAESFDEILAALNLLIENPECIAGYARNAYDAGIKNHSEEIIRQRLTSTVKMLLNVKQGD